jgi:hypothetical protein
MKRIKAILAVAVLLVAMLAASAAPAMAHNNGDFFRVNNGNNGDIFFNGNDNGFRNNFFPFNTFFFGNENFENCPFLGDTTGIVNEFDCFD